MQLERRSGVLLKRVYPDKITFSVSRGPATEKEAAVSLFKSATVSEDGKETYLYLGVGIHHKEGRGPFELDAVICGVFEKDEESTVKWDWKKFNDLNGLAILFPYLRELVSNITSRIGRPIILPPVNVAAMLEEGAQPGAQSSPQTIQPK